MEKENTDEETPAAAPTQVADHYAEAADRLRSANAEVLNQAVHEAVAEAMHVLQVTTPTMGAPQVSQLISTIDKCGQAARHAERLSHAAPEVFSTEARKAEAAVAALKGQHI